MTNSNFMYTLIFVFHLRFGPPPPSGIFLARMLRVSSAVLHGDDAVGYGDWCDGVDWILLAESMLYCF